MRPYEKLDRAKPRSKPVVGQAGRRGCGPFCKYFFGDHRSESQAVASAIFTPDATRRYCNAGVLLGSSLTF